MLIITIILLLIIEDLTAAYTNFEKSNILYAYYVDGILKPFM